MGKNIENTPMENNTESTNNNAEEKTATKKKSNKNKALLAIIGVIIVAAVGSWGVVTYNTNYSNTSENEQVFVSKAETVYTAKYQNAAQAKLEIAKSKNSYDEDNMLIRYNPFNTNTTSLYTYFITDSPAKVSYTVSAPDTDYGDFTATAYQASEYQNVHEFSVIGLIPETTNTITYTITYKDGTTKTHKETYKMGSLWGDEKVQLDTTTTAAGKKALAGTSSNGTSDGTLQQTSLTNGLYAVMGNDSTTQDFIFYYDVHGVLRGELPILDYRAHRLVFKQGIMYYSSDYNQIAGMNNLGKIVVTYTMPGKWQLHHDYAFDSDGNLLVLASNESYRTMEDRIVKINTKTGKMTQLVDFGDLLSAYKKITKKTSMQQGDDRWDWLHLNTIQWEEDGSVILSARETSTIMKVNNIESNPTIQYFIGESAFWANTPYASYSLKQIGNFENQTGQHSVTIQETDDLSDGQYYLTMYNNNMNYIVTRPKFNLQKYVPSASTLYKATQAQYKKFNSYYYKYLVDENAGTYKLVQSFKVPYSGVVSSVQQYGNTIVTDSGRQGTWSVRDNNGKILASYTMKLYTNIIYRVYKYDFEGFYFATTNTDKGNNLDQFDAQSSNGTNSYYVQSSYLQ